MSELQTTTDRRQFVLRRLHSLSGVLPIGAYLVFHIMLANASVLAGPESFDRMVGLIGGVPGGLLLGVEVLFIYLPLLFHALYGFVRIADADLPTVGRADHVGAHLYMLQRASGVVAFVFVGWHVWTTRVQYYFANAEISYTMMRGIMTEPVGFVLFLVGTLASVFHFTNGLWTFCITWGLTVGPRAQRAARLASLGAFVVMSGTAIAIMMAFRA